MFCSMSGPVLQQQQGHILHCNAMPSCNALTCHFHLEIGNWIPISRVYTCFNLDFMSICLTKGHSVAFAALVCGTWNHSKGFEVLAACSVLWINQFASWHILLQWYILIPKQKAQSLHFISFLGIAPQYKQYFQVFSVIKWSNMLGNKAWVNKFLELKFKFECGLYIPF